MIIEVDESFKKDFALIKNKEIEKRIINKLSLLERTLYIEDVSNVKKLK
jgi:hypothetical protein